MKKTGIAGRAKRLAALACAGAMLFLLAAPAACSGGGSEDASQTDWGSAHWIWNGKKYTENKWVDFRRDFTLEEAPAAAGVKIACDSKYWLYVNGERAVLEGGLNRSEEDATYYDTVDIAEYLREGENSICVQVWFWGYMTKYTHFKSSGAGGMILSSGLTGSDGGDIESGDGQWYCHVDPAYTKVSDGNNYLGETAIVYDATAAEAWTDDGFDPEAEGWSLASVSGEDEDDPGYAGDGPWGELVERPTPMYKDYGLTERTLSDCEEVSSADGVTTYMLTLPYNMQIYPYISLGGGTQEGLEVRAYTETYDMSTLDLTYVTAAGAQEYEGQGWISGDYLYFDVPDGCAVESVGYRQTGYDVSSGEDTLFAGYFDSVIGENDPSADSFTGGWTWESSEVSADNNLYDELWQKAEYTLYVCMRDTYMDCPDRERGQYIGDAVNEIEEAFYVFGPDADELSANAIRQACATQEEYSLNGRTYYSMSGVAPINGISEIPIQCLGTAVGAWNYYLYTGDASIAADCYEPLYNYLTNYDLEDSGTYAGTVRMRDTEDFTSDTGLLEWSDWGDNQDLRVCVTCWWYMSAEAVRNLAYVSGSGATDEQIAFIDGYMESIEESFDSFWDDDLQAYASDWGDEWYSTEYASDGTHLVDDRVNALAVVSGLADSSKYEAIRDVFMGTDSAPAYENASIYMEKYVLQALYMMGYDCDAMDRMQSRFCETVNDSTSSTLPELWPGTSNGADGTKNHGWSGGALTALSRYAAGIEPTEAGYAALRVRPMLGYFDEISACTPTEIGNVTLEVTQGSMTVTLPSGAASEIWVPADGGDVSLLSGSAEYGGLQAFGGHTYAVYACDGGTCVFSIG